MWLIGIPLMVLEASKQEEGGLDDDNEEMEVRCINPSSIDHLSHLMSHLIIHTQDLLEWQKERQSVKNYTYLTRDAVMNRLFFLISVALFIIFCICVARGGVIDNMEWIRDIAEMDYKQIESERDFLSKGYINYIPQPLVLVIASSGADDTYQVDLLKNLSKSFDYLGFNRSAIIWRYNNNNDRQDDTVYGWYVHYMNRDNATNMETLIAYMTEVLQVGVLYIDPSHPRIQSINYKDVNLVGRWVWQDEGAHSSQFHEDMVIAADDSDIDILTGFWVDTPSFVLAWRSQSTINLFKDAMDKIDKIPAPKKDLYHCFPFIVNFLLNDFSRQVLPIEIIVDAKNLAWASEELRYRLAPV